MPNETWMQRDLRVGIDEEQNVTTRGAGAGIAHGSNLPAIHRHDVSHQTVAQCLVSRQVEASSTTMTS